MARTKHHDAALEQATAGMAWHEERFENERTLEGRGGQDGSPIGPRSAFGAASQRAFLSVTLTAW